MDFAAVTRRVLDFAEARNLPLAVVGGLALHAYGVERLTRDLDLVTLRSAQAELVRFLESSGYESLHVSEGYSNHLHPKAENGRIDVVYVDTETAETLFGGAGTFELFPGLEVEVPRPEHLAAMKVRALANDPSRRLQDLADIQALMRCPGVNLAQIREYFERLGLGSDYDEIKRTL